jgi:hypothetical protein
VICRWWAGVGQRRCLLGSSAWTQMARPHQRPGTNGASSPARCSERAPTLRKCSMHEFHSAMPFPYRLQLLPARAPTSSPEAATATLRNSLKAFRCCQNVQHVDLTCELLRRTRTIRLRSDDETALRIGVTGDCAQLPRNEVNTRACGVPGHQDPQEPHACRHIFEKELTSLDGTRIFRQGCIVVSKPNCALPTCRPIGSVAGQLMMQFCLRASRLLG